MSTEPQGTAGWVAVALFGLTLNLVGPRVLAAPRGDWNLLERSEVHKDSSWARQLPLSDNGFPVMLIEDRSESGGQATRRYLVSVDCNSRLQAVRQFWEIGAATWQVVHPLEWQPADTVRTAQIVELACHGTIRR